VSRLHQRVTERYIEHYARVNASTDPRSMRPRTLKNMQATYGALVEGLPAGSRVLDIGCGTGFLLYWLSKQQGVVPAGVDLSPSMVAAAKDALPDVDVQCEEALAYLQRHPASFAGIFCTDVMEHMLDDDQCLDLVEAARRALAPGGFFLCRVPNAANLMGTFSRYMDLTHHRIYTEHSILALLAAGGFEECRVAPIRHTGPQGRLTALVEHWLHRLLFSCSGHRYKSVFSINVQVVGFKP